jgi:predicted  nucleic acid-binding Zn-ribbon protein
MIKVNALYFLLLIEMLVVFAGLVVFLLFRGKKRTTLYREGRAELESAHAAQEDLRKQVAALKTGAAQAAGSEAAAAKNQPAQGADAKELDACKMEITILEGQLKEKAKQLVDLQSKLDGVEKEYLLLYQQQQAQEQHKN